MKTIGLKTQLRFPAKIQPKTQWLFVTINKIRKIIFFIGSKKYS
jgi:hypothetical protein